MANLQIRKRTLKDRKREAKKIKKIITKEQQSGSRLKYPDPIKLQKEINKYFKFCDTKNIPYTTCGLANYLGIDRVTLLNYSKDLLHFTVIKAAKDRIEEWDEVQLKSRRNVTGLIFSLVNNHKWVNKQESDINLGNQGDHPLSLKVSFESEGQLDPLPSSGSDSDE